MYMDQYWPALLNYPLLFIIPDSQDTFFPITPFPTGLITQKVGLLLIHIVADEFSIAMF